MKTIKLRVPFKFHHAEIPAGSEISVPAGIAFQLIKQEVAEEVVSQAVIEPEETRVAVQQQTRMVPETARKRTYRKRRG